MRPALHMPLAEITTAASFVSLIRMESAVEVDIFQVGQPQRILAVFQKVLRFSVEVGVVAAENFRRLDGQRTVQINRHVFGQLSRAQQKMKRINDFLRSFHGKRRDDDFLSVFL